MTATDALRQEHQAIAKMVKAARICARAIQAGNTDELETITRLADFFTNFADRCHHGKEENILFPVLVEKGMSADAGLIIAMRVEHVHGRQYVKGMVDSIARIKDGQEHAVPMLVNTLNGYASLLEKHIAQENGVLFPMAEELLTEFEQAALYETFEEYEKQEIGEGVHERYHDLIHELSRKYNL